MHRPGRKASSVLTTVDRPGHRLHRFCDRGLVTVELAVSLLSVMVLLIMFGWALFVVTVQLRCIDTAAEIARQQARGDQSAVSAARQKAPEGAAVEIARHGESITVEVAVTVRPLNAGLPGIPLRATATAIAEPGERGSP